MFRQVKHRLCSDKSDIGYVNKFEVMLTNLPIKKTPIPLLLKISLICLWRDRDQDPPVLIKKNIFNWESKYKHFTLEVQTTITPTPRSF